MQIKSSVTHVCSAIAANENWSVGNTVFSMSLFGRSAALSWFKFLFELYTEMARILLEGKHSAMSLSCIISQEELNMANLPSVRRGSFFGEQKNPLHAMARMQREMDKMFESFWSGNWMLNQPEMATAFQPLYNMEEKGSHYLLSFDVPGFSKDDIKIEVQDNQLHIFGESKEEHREKKGKRFESSYGSLEQWLTLPQNSKADSVEAQVENGVLRIAIAKTETSKAKEIKVGEGKTGIISKLLERKEKAA